MRKILTQTIIDGLPDDERANLERREDVKAQTDTRTARARAKMARTLGDPARIMILQALAEFPSLDSGPLAAALPARNAPRLTWHLLRLRRAGLIARKDIPPRCRYSLTRRGRQVAALIEYL